MADKRTIRTREQIAGAFYALMKEKDPADIQVAELCREAGINRSTFYDHYKSVEELQRALLREIIEENKSFFRQYHFDMDSKATVSALCTSIRENPEKYTLFFHPAVGPLLQDQLWNYFDQSAIPRWMEESEITEEQAYYILRFIETGGTAILQTWYSGGCTTKQAVVEDLFDNLIKYGIYNYLYTK